jgi:long-chain acyl-CoA synthetase
MDIKRAFDLLYYQDENYPLKNAVNFKDGDKWKGYNTQQIIKISNQLSLGLLELGIKKGDNIALISGSRPEWNFIDLAVQQIGAVLVPLYTNLGVKDYSYIINEAEIKLVFVSNYEHLEKIIDAAPQLSFETIFSFDKIPNARHWTEVATLGAKGSKETLEKVKDGVVETDLLTIIYTSGTTGNPKGVMLTHKNIVSNVIAATNTTTVKRGSSRALSFLPLNHVFERVGVYMYLYLGVEIYYAESIEKVAENIKEVKPHTFNTVPRLLEKIYDKIIAKGDELSTIKKGLFFWAVNLALKFDPSTKPSGLFAQQLAVADKLIFSKWREAVGGNLESIQCGAAALQPRLARVFWAAGIKVYEGYGLTETSPIITSSIAEATKAGYVGKVIEGVEIKIAADGEILCKGPNVMLGYYKNEELTNEVIKDGWLHTGDIGEVNDGYLKITDRKKELFKTSGGLYIAPQLVENKLKESTLIDQVIVVGEGKKFPAALIVPNFDKLSELASENFVLFSDDDSFEENEFIVEAFQKEIDILNKDLGKWEKIKSFRILQSPWGPDSGELTPTLKLKRRVIHEKYASIIKDIYKGDGSELFEDAQNFDENDLDPELAKELAR